MADPKSFERQLAALVSAELRAAGYDFDRLAAMLERLINAAGLVIAIGGQGQAEGMQTMIDGVDGYLYEAASGHAKLGAMVATIQRMKAKRPPPEPA